ncbi:UNVERIFIED_CONTAM: hypothetical protein NCL1_52758 [Trichonephila clavipes]
MFNVGQCVALKPKQLPIPDMSSNVRRTAIVYVKNCVFLVNRGLLTPDLHCVEKLLKALPAKKRKKLTASAGKDSKTYFAMKSLASVMFRCVGNTSRAFDDISTLCLKPAMAFSGSAPMLTSSMTNFSIL